MTTPAIQPLAYSTAPLIEALAEYDADQPRRDNLWAIAQHDGHVRHAEHEDQKALRKVQVAFWEVTKDRNSFDHCMALRDLPYMRRIAALPVPGATP